MNTVRDFFFLGLDKVPLVCLPFRTPGACEFIRQLQEHCSQEAVTLLRTQNSSSSSSMTLSEEGPRRKVRKIYTIFLYISIPPPHLTKHVEDGNYPGEVRDF